MLLEIEQAPPDGKKIRTDKGLNFPDTDLEVAPLTAKDREDLAFVVRHADMIGYSFVQSAADVELLATTSTSVAEVIATRRTAAAFKLWTYELPPSAKATARRDARTNTSRSKKIRSSAATPMTSSPAIIPRTVTNEKKASDSRASPTKSEKKKSQS